MVKFPLDHILNILKALPYTSYRYGILISLWDHGGERTWPRLVLKQRLLWHFKKFALKLSVQLLDLDVLVLRNTQTQQGKSRYVCTVHKVIS